MHQRIRCSWQVLAATLLAAACSESSGPSLRGLIPPQFSVALDQQNGTMGPAGGTTVMAKGFNGDNTNPRHGAAVVATFLWTGPAGIITSVHDRLANGRPVGNTFHLVESAS